MDIGSIEHVSGVRKDKVVETLDQIIAGDDGTDLGQRKVRSLHENSNFFRRRLMEMGCRVLGEHDWNRKFAQQRDESG